MENQLPRYQSGSFFGLLFVRRWRTYPPNAHIIRELTASTGRIINEAALVGMSPAKKASRGSQFRKISRPYRPVHRLA